MSESSLITCAIKENRPELITSHVGFDVSKLRTKSCGLADMRISSNVNCFGLHCSECPFGRKELKGVFERQTLKSMKKWLKIE